MMQVYPAMVLHNYGSTFFIHETDAGRTRAIAKWCRENWNGEPLPDSDDEAINTYFENVLEETLWIDNEPEWLEE
jgi:hypothetical protein